MVRALMLCACFAGTAPGAWAHEGHSAPANARRGTEAVETPFGRPGSRPTRTVSLAMDDRMRFTPDALEVKRGETLRFVIRNEGKLLHELVLGTEAELARHADLMRRFPDMEHDEPNMVHVKPGAAGELLWTFDKRGRFAFACLVSGHFEAGMRGTINVK